MPCILRWPGKVGAGKVENGLFSSLDWFPTFLAAAGEPHVADELKKGKELAGHSYRVHLDGYDQREFLAGKESSRRNEIHYFAEATLGAIRLGDYKFRFIDKPNGWFGGTVKVDWPSLVNIRLDPFERTGLGQSFQQAKWFTSNSGASSSYKMKWPNSTKISSSFPAPEAGLFQPRRRERARAEGHALAPRCMSIKRGAFSR